MMSDTRGQAYTLEGIISAIIIASALVIGLQAVDPSPWTDEDPNINPEEMRTLVSDSLEVSSDQGELRKAVTCVDIDEESDEIDMSAFSPDGAVGKLLDETTGTNNYLVSVRYHNEVKGEQRIIGEEGLGTPGGNAITVTRQIALFDSDRTYGGDTCTDRRATLEEDEQYEIDDQYEDDELYAMVEIEVVVW